MKVSRNSILVLGFAASVGLTGCASSKVDLSKLTRPPRSAQLDAYEFFVGSWDLSATMPTVDGKDETWTGTARWEWTLDRRCLYGQISYRSAKTSYEAAGIWSWDSKRDRFVWWMFNDWGYPMEGTAAFDEKNKTWTMPYTSVGLDGTTSHGRFTMRIVDRNSAEWSFEEWADTFHTIKKMEMRGSYHRKK